MKKIISMLLVFTMLVSFAPTFSMAADDTTPGIVNYIKTLVCLSKSNVIESYGLTPSVDCMKTGIYTALFQGEDLKKETELEIAEAEFSRARFLEFNIYSPKATDTNLAVILYADNPETEERDCYYTMVDANFEGWKLFSVNFKDFEIVGSPKGFETVGSLSIYPGFNDTNVDDDAKLYFDDFVIRYFETFVPDEKAKEPKPYVLLDPKKGDNHGAKYTVFDGVPCLKWAGYDNLMNSMIVEVPDDVKLSDYNEMVVRVYSEKTTHNSVNFYMYADDPATSSKDFYYTGFSCSWEGEWKDIRIPLHTDWGLGINKIRSTIGSIDEITSIKIEPTGASNAFYPDTVMYIAGITLEGKPQKENDIVGDYILKDNYDSEKMVDYVSLIKEKHPDKHHPRLIINDEKLNEIKRYKDTDIFLGQAYDKVMNMADVYVQTPPLDSLKDSGVLGDTTRVSCDIKDIALYCGLAYQLTGEGKYADRIWQEIEVMTDTNSKWSEVNMLDTGVATFGFALAYDWCYDQWDETQKRIIRNAIMRNTFESVQQQFYRGFGSWLTQPGNWNEVIANGTMCASLAIGDEEGYSDIVNEIINHTIYRLPIHGLYGFAPDGAYGEGASYWNLALYTFFTMTNSMKTALGTDAGLEDFPGLSKTGYFPFGITGPMGTFNHSDSWKNVFDGGVPVYLYLGYRYNIPNLVSYRVNHIDETLEVYDLLWYDPKVPVIADHCEGLELDYTPSGVEPQGSFRTGFGKDDYFIAFKGGNNFAGHDQYDIGSFIIDANGVRWIEDTGAETYYFTGDRGKYYRMRAEGNNCLQFNPELSRMTEQTEGYNRFHTVCDYTDKGSSKGGAYAVYDILPAYIADIKEGRRGFALINNRTQFVIQDEFTTLKPSEVYSYYHFSSENTVEFSEDKMSAVITTPDGKKCAIHLRTDIKDAHLDVMDAVHHPSSPKPTKQDAPGNDNRIFRKLYVHGEDVTNATISIIFTPLVSDEEIVELPRFLPLDNWSTYLKEGAKLTSVKVDGIQLETFNSGVGTYNVYADTVGYVEASAPEGLDITVKQAENLGDTALITVKNPKTTDEFTYKVKFIKNAEPPVATGAEVVSVSASHVPEIANPPQNAVDGKLNNRFAADGNMWLLCDLGSPKYLNGASIAFFNGHTRRNVFNLEVSLDGETFTKVFDGKSPGDTDKLYRYDFSEPVLARYVRFNGFGCVDINDNPVNVWNSIAEMAIHQIYPDFDDSANHWAKNEIQYMRKYGLVEGVGDNLYMPENSVTVAEFLTMVTRTCNFLEETYKGTFTDVSSSDWYAPYIASAYKNGIIPLEMITDGKINPNDKLTREQMCAVSVLAYTKTLKKNPSKQNLTDNFDDIGETPYQSYIDQALGLKLVNGMGERTFSPSSDITRAQAATILKRLFVKIYNDN